MFKCQHPESWQIRLSEGAFKIHCKGTERHELSGKIQMCMSASKVAPAIIDRSNIEVPGGKDLVDEISRWE